jgi:O-antigen ligase
MSRPLTGHIFLAPGLVLITVAIGGRYTLDRAGLRDLAWVDLRVIGLAAAVAVLAIDLARRPRAQLAHRAEGWLVLATLFFLYQVASGLWAPASARAGEKALDVVLMAVLAVAFYLYALGAPGTVTRLTFLLFFITAVVFALGALLLAGPGVQGRYAAFGGGPNVFVRIELLGVISAVALYRFTGRIITLLAVPLFLFAALLSGSRAGLLAGAVVGAAALVRGWRRLTFAPTVLVAAALAAVAGVVLALAPPAVTGLFQERFVEQTVEQRYVSGRTDIWAEAARLAVEHPALGAGLDGFYGLVGRVQEVEYPHNYVLGVAAEGGLVGLALLSASVVLWVRTIRSGGGHPTETGFAVAAAAYVALSSLFSGDYYDARLAWLFAAMAAAAAVTPTEPGPAATAGRAPSDPAVPDTRAAPTSPGPRLFFQERLRR